MVLNRWNDTRAKEILEQAGGNPADQDLALRLYTSRLIGADPELVLHGGGNTSCKVRRTDLFGQERAVLHVKGSGCDLKDVSATDMPGLDLTALKMLRSLDHLDDADMVNYLRGALLDANAPYPSLETLLHAFLPHRFIDHTHASAMLVLADLKDAEAVVQEIFGDTLACVPYEKPGFGLAQLAAQAFENHPQAEGLLLLKHGHFAFGDSARQSYDRLIEQTNKAEAWIARRTKAFPAGKPVSAPMAAKEFLPTLRGVLGEEIAEFRQDRDSAMPILSLRSDTRTMAFLSRPDLPELSGRGVPTPDHAFRVKNLPLLLTPAQIKQGREGIHEAVSHYVREYREYYKRNNARSGGDKVLLEPTPNMIWVPGVGAIGAGETARAAAIASDLIEQNMAVTAAGEACGGYHPLDEQRLFDMEYWSLEQAKLGSRDLPAFAGRVVLVTGGGGAIGLATARAFANLGASIFVVDLEQDALNRALETLGADHRGLAMDITGEGAAEKAMAACVAAFGGLDILVSNAGAAWTGELRELDDTTLRKSFELNFFAHQTFSKAAARLFQLQGRGGQILFNVSKQAVNPGKGFGAYGLPKAATFFLLRQLALELGPEGVRVNGINADRIRSGLLDEAFVAKRAKARGIDEATYMAGNLIRREVEARHVADAFVALALSERTTAHVMTVDGGNIEAALR